MKTFRLPLVLVMVTFAAVSGSFEGISQAVATGQQTPPAHSMRQTESAYSYRYTGPVFSRFINDSYRDGGQTPNPGFRRWFAESYKRAQVFYPGKPSLSLEAALAAVAADYRNARTPQARTTIESRTGTWLHGAVKKAIPKFSLDRGFEFRFAEQQGERQCFLQSVLVAGMMQQVGMRAGVAMVSKNEKGQDTNNGHAVTLVKLSDGRDLIVDVSHSHPTVRQQGLFVADRQTGSYRYVLPVFGSSDAVIGYKTPAGAKVNVSRVTPLDVAFVRSQFDYYRGERVANGLLAKPTPEGLSREAAYLRRAVRECPKNPLAVYMLGRVYLRMGKADPARRQIDVAHDLYKQAGWVPQGAREALALVHAVPPRISAR